MPTNRSEVAWLIEKRSIAGDRQPRWLGPHDGLEFTWTDEPNKAIRFVRRCDAEGLCGLFENEDVVIAEHLWIVQYRTR